MIWRQCCFVFVCYSVHDAWLRTWMGYSRSIKSKDKMAITSLLISHVSPLVPRMVSTAWVTDD